MTDQTITLQPGDTLTITTAAAAPAPAPTPAPDVTGLESAIDAAVSSAIAAWQSPTAPVAVPPVLALVPDLVPVPADTGVPPAFSPNT
jgi:hypothetical protein